MGRKMKEKRPDKIVVMYGDKKAGVLKVKKGKKDVKPTKFPSS